MKSDGEIYYSLYFATSDKALKIEELELAMESEVTES